MKKLLIVTKDNKLLLSMDKEEDTVVDNSIEISANNDGTVVRLLKDYKLEGDIDVVIRNGEIMYHW